MKRIKKISVLLFTALFIVGALVACSKDENETGNTIKNDVRASTVDGEKKQDAKNKQSGNLSIAGSTSMEKLSNTAAEAFMEKYNDIQVSAEFIGSSAGVEAVISGIADIGNASRNLKESEKEAGAVENIVAIDGIAVIVDKSNKVQDLTRDELVQVYTGEITNWSELGGMNQPIVVIGREAGSGTRGAFEEILKVEDLCQYSNEINSTGGVMGKVASTPGAIGYISLDLVNETVQALKLDGVEATAEKIKEGEYFLNRPFVMATKGEISEQNEVVQKFFEYLSSEEGKEIIKGVGLITVD